MPARRVRSHSRGCGGGSLPERTRASRGLAAAMKGSDTPSPPAGAWRWLRRHRPPRRSPAPPAGPGLGHMQPREPQAREALTWLPPGPPRAHWVTCPSEATGGPCPEHPEPSGKGPREPGTRPARGARPLAPTLPSRGGESPSVPRCRSPQAPQGTASRRCHPRHPRRNAGLQRLPPSAHSGAQSLLSRPAHENQASVSPVPEPIPVEGLWPR